LDLKLSAKAIRLEDMLPWRDMYRLEMGCQIIHYSIHARAGWTREYCVWRNEVPIGYGSIAIGGPWTGKPTLYEFYLAPQHRLEMFDSFAALLAASQPVAIETQSTDVF